MSQAASGDLVISVRSWAADPLRLWLTTHRRTRPEGVWELQPSQSGIIRANLGQNSGKSAKESEVLVFAEMQICNSGLHDSFEKYWRHIYENFCRMGEGKEIFSQEFLGKKRKSP